MVISPKLFTAVLRGTNPNSFAVFYALRVHKYKHPHNPNKPATITDIATIANIGELEVLPALFELQSIEVIDYKADGQSISFEIIKIQGYKLEKSINQKIKANATTTTK